MSIQDLSDELLIHVTSYLSTRDCIKFITQVIKELSFHDTEYINNMLEISISMNNILCNHSLSEYKKQDKIGTLLQRVSEYGYDDLAKELILTFDFNDDQDFRYLNYSAMNACRNDHASLVIFYYNKIKLIKPRSKNPHENYMFDYIAYAVRNDDIKFIQKLIRDNPKNIHYIVSLYAKKCDFDMVKYYHDYVKNICYCNDEALKYDDGMYAYFGGKFCSCEELLCEHLWLHIDSQSHCESCLAGTEKYKLPSWSNVLQDAAIGGSLEIIKYLIDNSENDYNDGLIGATIKGDKLLIDYFITLGANNWREALKYCVQSDHVHLIDFFYRKVQDLTVFRSLISDNELGWDWILPELRYINDTHMKQSIDFNKLMNHGAQHGHMNIIQYAINKGANINELMLDE